MAKVNYREIAGFPGYRIGDDGSVWSRRPINGRGPLRRKWRRKIANRSGQYPRVCLSRNGEKSWFAIHLLVLETFVGPCPPGMQACHFPDRDRDNFALGNLRWDTPKNNHADRKAHNTDPKGERNPAAKIDTSAVLKIREQRKRGRTLESIAKAFGVSFGQVWKIVQRRSWRHVA